jgi:stage III sporulation protein AF
MEIFKGWITNVCTAVFFITAVEMILPDNKIKKYAKFVLGLILIAVLINPLVMYLNRGDDISTFINQSNSIFNNGNIGLDSQKYKEKSIEDTLNVFRQNLEKVCEERLKEEYVKGTYKVKAEVGYDDKKEEFTVKGISVGVSSGNVEKIQKIEIRANSEHSSNGKAPSEMGKEIKDYLSKELQLSKDIISVYKLGN